MTKRTSTLADYERKLSPMTKDLLSVRSDDEFNLAIDNLLADGLDKLERNKKHFTSLQEEGLTAVLAGNIGSSEVSAICEANSNGHVDLTIRINHLPQHRVCLGEAKLWKGNKYHADGVEQLLKRYSTGRECRGFVVSYVRIPNISGKFGELRKYLEQAKPYALQPPCEDHSLSWSFRSRHQHSSGEVVQVSHLGCNLYVEEGS